MTPDGKPIKFDCLIMRTKYVKVTFTYEGEGVNGDYDPSDKHDQPLVRLDVAIKGPYTEGRDYDRVDGWAIPDNNSICTNIDARSSKAKLYGYLAYAAYVLNQDLNSNKSVKKIVAELSWMGD